MNERSRSAHLHEAREKSENFSELHPLEQAKVYKKMAMDTLSPEVYFDDLTVHPKKNGSGFYQYFRLADCKAPTDVNDLLENQIIYRNMFSAKDPHERKYSGTTKEQVQENALGRIYKWIHEIPLQEDIEIPKEWLDQEKRNIKPNCDYERKAKTYYKEAIDHRRKDLAREFKIHIQPKLDQLPEIAKLIIDLIAQDSDFNWEINAFKIKCFSPDDKAAQGKPSIVIYPKAGKTPVDSIFIAKKTLAKLIHKLSTTRIDSDTLPGYNFEISNGIHVAQSSRDLKEKLADIPDPDIPEGYETDPTHDSLLTTYFNKADNYAFFHEESALANKVFGELRDKIVEQGKEV
ncbi:MAG: hypothetical protein ABII02_04665 [Candidatus Magasanikbacteria bacterium]